MSSAVRSWDGARKHRSEGGTRPPTVVSNGVDSDGVDSDGVDSDGDGTAGIEPGDTVVVIVEVGPEGKTTVTVFEHTVR